MKFKSLKKLLTMGALMSTLSYTGKANTVTNSVEEADLPAGTIKDIALANNQLLITSDDARIGNVPVKLFSANTNNLNAAFGAGNTTEILFTNNIAGITYDSHSTNAWYSLEGTHDKYILGNMNVSKSALSSVGHRDSAEIKSDRFDDFPSPYLCTADGHLWLSFIDPDDEMVCASQYQINENTNLVETANDYFDGKEFSKIHSSTTDNANIWWTVTDKNGQDSILYTELGSDVWGNKDGIKSSCGVALLGEKVYAVSSDQKKLIQFSKDLSSSFDVVNFNNKKVSAIASDGQHIFVASEKGDEIYKISPENSVQTIVLDRRRKTPIKKIIASKGTIYGATARSIMKTRSE